MNCPDCNGTGRVQLLFSDVACDCSAPRDADFTPFDQSDEELVAEELAIDSKAANRAFLNAIDGCSRPDPERTAPSPDLARPGTIRVSSWDMPEHQAYKLIVSWRTYGGERMEARRVVTYEGRGAGLRGLGLWLTDMIQEALCGKR